MLTIDSVVIHDTITLYVPEVHTDTVVTLKELIDTVTLTKDRVTVKPIYTGSQVIRQSILYLFPVTGVVPRIYLWCQIRN